MKQISTHQSDDRLESLRDDVYTLFQMEVERRGLMYFNMLANFPGINGNVSSGAIESFLKRLAVNPSVITLLTSKDPDKAIDNLLGDEARDGILIGYIRDFIDDTTLNIRMKHPELYQLRLQTLEIHLSEVIPTIVSDVDACKNIMEFYHANKHMVLALFYLRKIGYGSITKSSPHK